MASTGHVLSLHTLDRKLAMGELLLFEISTALWGECEVMEMYTITDMCLWVSCVCVWVCGVCVCVCVWVGGWVCVYVCVCVCVCVYVCV